MAVKNTVAKTWVLLPSFDGYLYSAYPNGDKPSGYVSTPTLIDTDIIAGPLSGGENNKGCYMSLFGYNLGLRSNLGTATGARVYFRDPAGANTWVEVDNYRVLQTSRTYSKNQVVQIIVQLGALGGKTGLLDIKITVNGVDTNILTGQFTVQPGRIAFVSTTGNDATGVFDDITKPFRYIQNYSGGSPVAGSLWATTTTMGETGIRPGDTIVIRGGTWSDQVGYDTRWARFRDKGGTAPNGTLGQGYITFTRYPGPVLGHAPEDVSYVDPTGGRGGIQGCPTAYGAPNANNGQYVVVSGLRFQLSATSVSDSGGVNFQTSANYWRVFDCEIGPWPTTTIGLLGGIGGNGNPLRIRFNYVHDIGGPAGLTNHGIYLDGSNLTAKNADIAYNWIKNITGGSAIQFFNQSAADYFTGLTVHNNYVDGCAKYGINLNAYLQSADVYNNIVKGAGINSVNIDGNHTPAINIVHNTFIQSLTSGAYTRMIANSGGAITTGTGIKIQHNVLYIASGADSTLNYTNLGAGDTTVTMTENRYYDANGLQITVPTKDATGIYGNPTFTSVSTDNYTRTANLGDCAAAEVFAVATDFFGWPRPVTGTGAPGATKNDIGAAQDSGT